VKPSEIEEWALRVLDLIAAGGRVEDDLVELKREWPSDPSRSARRIAAQANAARGEPFLWLIGVDERTGEIIPPADDPAQTWERLKAEFDGQPPRLALVNVRGVHAYCFEPNLPVYVVRAGSNLSMTQLEVPWREGTRVRCATQADLIQVLTPPTQRPEIEVREPRLRAIVSANPSIVTLKALASIFVIPPTTDQIVVPYHRCRCNIALDGSPADPPHLNLYCEQAPGPQSPNVSVTSTELSCRGPGHARLRINTSMPRDTIWPTREITLHLQFAIVPGNGVVPVTLALPALPPKAPDWRDWGSPLGPTP
jgi:hypothetical protein